MDQFVLTSDWFHLKRDLLSGVCFSSLSVKDAAGFGEVTVGRRPTWGPSWSHTCNNWDFAVQLMGSCLTCLSPLPPCSFVGDTQTSPRGATKQTAHDFWPGHESCRWTTGAASARGKRKLSFGEFVQTDTCFPAGLRQTAADGHTRRPHRGLLFRPSHCWVHGRVSKARHKTFTAEHLHLQPNWLNEMAG